MPDDARTKDQRDNKILYSVMDNDQLAECSAAESNFEEMIGDRLRQYYASRLSQPLPNKFVDLLRDLAKKEAES
jgi:hypothetical protein